MLSLHWTFVFACRLYFCTELFICAADIRWLSPDLCQRAGRVRGSRVELLGRLEIGFLCGWIQHDIIQQRCMVKHGKRKRQEYSSLGIFVSVQPANPFTCDLNLFECVNFHRKIFACLRIKVVSLSCRDVTLDFEVPRHPGPAQPSNTGTRRAWILITSAPPHSIEFLNSDIKILWRIHNQYWAKILIKTPD